MALGLIVLFSYKIESKMRREREKVSIYCIEMRRRSDVRLY
jgi:hypothetical protein